MIAGLFERPVKVEEDESSGPMEIYEDDVVSCSFP
jgi:hypothetical protein